MGYPRLFVAPLGLVPQPVVAEEHWLMVGVAVAEEHRLMVGEEEVVAEAAEHQLVVVGLSSLAGQEAKLVRRCFAALAH